MKNYGNNPDTERCYENSYIGGILTFKILIHKNILEMSLALKYLVQGLSLFLPDNADKIKITMSLFHWRQIYCQLP